MGLDTVELVMAIEEEFGIEIPNEDAANLNTAGDISAYVLNRLKAQGRQATAESTWQQIKSIIVDQLGVTEEQVVPTARIVHDLGAN
jgi:acyl carrier protein